MKMRSKYSGSCRKCGGFIPVGTLILWDRAEGARHEQCRVRKPAEVSEPQVKAVVDATAIVSFLMAARDRGLKFPKATFLAPGGGELRLSVAGARAKVPGAVQVVVDRDWAGRVNPDGAVVGRLAGDAALLATLDAIAADPAAAASAYGALTGACSFCAKSLKDEGSVEVGYGPVCAKKYGLPHKRKGAKELEAEVPTSGAQFSAEAIRTADAAFEARCRLAERMMDDRAGLHEDSRWLGEQ